MAKQGSSSSPLSSTTFEEYNTKLQSSALKATRNAAALPADINFYRSLDAGVAHDIDNLSSRVLGLTNKLLGLSSSLNPNTAVKGKGKAKLEDQDDVVIDFHSLVVDVMDQLFERTDSCLDQVLGRTKAPAITVNPSTADLAPQRRKKITPKGTLEPVIHHAWHLEKPQLLFKRKPDNSDAPWHPVLSHKYNAKVPLGHIYTDTEEDVNMAGNSTLLTNHPYRYEINHISYPSHVYAPVNPKHPPPLSETPFTWISTPEALQTMLEKLRAAKEIAVDLEHHSYRSYLGFLCLMQISTRDEDFVVDVISLRGDVEALNEVFTDPNIVKVFHGAESDIVWLQQDFNLYVVNLFDTFHASKLLEFPRHGLANLLEMYCDYIPDKRYQLADWRIRPLPEEMLEYARSDTHFLLFIYDNLRNALLDRATSRSRSSSPPTNISSSNTNPNTPIICAPPSTANASTSPSHTLINHVLTRSAETCLRVYAKEPYDHTSGSGSNGWDNLAKKWNKPFFTANASLSTPPPADATTSLQVLVMQKAVYRTVHWWREKAAREEDESTRYVMPNQYLFKIAEAPPADLAALLRVFGAQVPAVVKKRAKELLEAIREAVKTSLTDIVAAGMGEEQEASEAAVDKEVPKDEVMGEVNVVRVEQMSKEETEKLWGAGTVNALTKASSSLLGERPSRSLSLRSSPVTTYTATQSTLFGHIKNTSSASAQSDPIRTEPGSTRFQELVAKINSTLVIVPTVPRVTTSSVPEEPSTSEAMTAQAPEDTTGMQIEIPFVPVSQRQTTTAVVEAKEKDSVVVVGQTKSKKRKRTRSTITSRGKVKEIPDRAGGEGDEVEGEVFDFASVPNILDDNPDEGGDVRKPVKKQKKGKGGQFFGDFPAPPKAHSEFKGGNLSRTFK